MPAPQGNDGFGYPPYAKFDLKHNPGYDFLRMLKWCADVEEKKFQEVFAAYSRDPIAILLGSAAIEGYVNYVGHVCDVEWERFIKTSKTFSGKLKRVFAARGKQIDLSQGIYQKATRLLKFRGSLAHPRFKHHIEERDSPPPTVFDDASWDFPAQEVRKIAIEFRKTLLLDLELNDHWHSQGYAEIHKTDGKA